MKCSMCSLWRPSLLLWVGLILHCAEARVNTEIQAGPLYRVEGSVLSISCNVSGFKDEMVNKIFKFRVKKPSHSNEINVISTGDPDFAYAVYKNRKSDVSVTHVNPNSAVLEIKNLRKDDEGEYDCNVEDTERSYNGLYNAKTVVKVIDNSLSVSSSESSTSLSYNEEEALTLTCQASSNTIQHTHLSLGWYLQKDGEPQSIISLDRYFTLIPGQDFEQRYRDGAISLDKLGEATYQLTMAQLQLSDQGRIYCQAQEWIQDPDRSWYMIAQKNADPTDLTVKAREVLDMSSLVVKMEAEQAALQEGEELILSCNIDTQNLEERFFSVAWLWNDNELVRIGPTGVLSVQPEHKNREEEGKLRATRTGSKTYQLILNPVRIADQGRFVCRVWLEERGNDGSFAKGTTKDSDPLRVKVSAIESELSVKMQDSQLAVNEQDKLRLVCSVSGFKGQLSVVWQVRGKTVFTDVISLSQEGVVETAAHFMSRKVRATRPADDSFVFELDGVTPSDAGTYQCTVSELKTDGKTHSQSQTADVSVLSVESLLKVTLKSRDNEVTVGGKVDLICKVSGPSIPINVIWSKQNKDSILNAIVTLSSDGHISWSGDEHQYQVTVKRQKNELMYYLSIINTSHREAGNYQCMVSAFLENVYKKLPPSNLLNVMVRNPDSKLALSSSPSISASISTDIQINCTVTSKSESYYSSQFAVTWLHQDAGNTTIMSSDRDAVVTFGPQIDKQRISMRRTSGPTFELTIRQARISDGGLYWCKVVEWLQDPRGDWYSLPEKWTATELDVTEPDINLSIEKSEEVKNISKQEDFAIPCRITQQSSEEAQFKVTWFWQKDTEKKIPIFTSYRNSTLQSWLGKDAVRFERPLPNLFNLTVLKHGPENSGLYFCEVEEWLHSPSDGWKRFAVENSGNVNVTVQTDEKNLSVSQCQSRTWMMSLIIVAIISLLVIVIMGLMLHRNKTSGGNKSALSLWAEQLPLNVKD